MSIPPSHPGVFVEEISSGGHEIPGVPTSITAFIGVAPRGLVNAPRRITTFDDYIREFGGLAAESTMSYAVRDFFVNGGTHALIVRIASGATPATATLHGVGGSLVLEAASPGAWGLGLRAAVAYPADVVSTTLFNLIIEGTAGSESFFRVSTDPDDPGFLPPILENSSTLVRATSVAGRPDETSVSIPFTGGSDGSRPEETDFIGDADLRTGMHALDHAEFNLLCIPPPDRESDTPAGVWTAAAESCVRHRAMLLVDPSRTWDAERKQAVSAALTGKDTIGITGEAALNAALYFPRLVQADPLCDDRLDTFVPCGSVAGVIARTDAQRGVWKAPAGIDAALEGVAALSVKLTEAENGVLNPAGINCLRTFPLYTVIWGARTLHGAGEYRYVPVRRLALFIEESVLRGTKWTVFEPNDERLWSQIRLSAGAFLQSLFRRGAFQGSTPRHAYFVQCDSATTTAADIEAGRLNIVIGFAPVKPAEFVVLNIQQIARRPPP